VVKWGVNNMQLQSLIFHKGHKLVIRGGIPKDGGACPLGGAAHDIDDG
jgi:hypothetical protein